MRCYVLVTLAAMAVFVFCVSSRSSGEPKPSRTSAAAYHDDPRFERAAPPLPEGIEVREVVLALGKTTGIPVLDPRGDVPRPEPAPLEALTVSFTLGQKRVAAFLQREAPARDVMDALARAVGAQWRRVDGYWVMTDRPELAALLTLPPLVIGRHAGEAFAPCKNLTPQQVELLQSRGVLFADDLTDEQRRGLRTATALWSQVYSDVAPEAEQLQGVFMKLHFFQQSVSGSSEPPTQGCELALFLPGRDGWPWQCLSFDVGQLRMRPPLGPGSGGLSSRDRFSFTESRPPRPKGDRAGDPKDKRLDARVKDYGFLVNHAAKGVSQAAGVSVLLSTHLRNRSCSLGSRQPTADEVLRAIEEATGGIWRRSGNMYALEPDHTVERIAQLQPENQQEWRDAAFIAVHQSLAGRSRETLSAGKELIPERMSNRQRDRLRWAATVAFATMPKLAARAMDLDGVSLKTLAADRAQGLTRRVQYLLPTVSGGTQVVATLAF